MLLNEDEIWHSVDEMNMKYCIKRPQNTTFNTNMGDNYMTENII